MALYVTQYFIQLSKDDCESETISCLCKITQGNFVAIKAAFLRMKNSGAATIQMDSKFAISAAICWHYVESINKASKRQSYS